MPKKVRFSRKNALHITAYMLLLERTPQIGAIMLDQIVYEMDPLTREEINRQLLLDDENAVVAEDEPKKESNENNSDSDIDLTDVPF